MHTGIGKARRPVKRAGPIAEIRELREALELARGKLARAERDYDLDKAAELRNGTVPNLEARLADAEASVKQGNGDRLLKEVAEKSGCPRAVLMQRAAEIVWSDFDGVERLGITAGASAPEVLVEEIMGAFAERYILDIETVTATEEGVFFPLPRPLRDHEAAE